MPNRKSWYRLQKAKPDLACKVIENTEFIKILKSKESKWLTNTFTIILLTYLYLNILNILQIILLLVWSHVN